MDGGDVGDVGVEVGLRSRSRCSLEDRGYTDPLPLTQCSPVAKPRPNTCIIMYVHICIVCLWPCFGPGKGIQVQVQVGCLVAMSSMYSIRLPPHRGDPPRQPTI